jgi:hypothetical protein
MSQALMFLALWFVFGVLTLGFGWILFPALYWLAAIRGSAARAEIAQQKLKSTLMHSESVISFAIQKRCASLFYRRQVIAITSSRMITLNRSWFGGFTMLDYQWKDLRDATLQENIFPAMFGSKLTFVVEEDKPQLMIDGLPGDAAASIYSRSQGEEQSWEEKRRIRDMEEDRSGIGISGGGRENATLLEELGRAKALFDAAAITDVEYQEIKAKIISRA